MTAEFRIVATELDNSTADEAGFVHGHTFGLWVDDERVLRCHGVWSGDLWGQLKDAGRDPRSHPLAGRIRRALVESLKVVQQVAADPETEVVDLCHG